MRIGICDDVKMEREALRENVSAYCEENKIKAEITCYETCEELLEVKTMHNLLFLDIEMPGIGGIEVGKRYHNKFPECKLILASGRTEKMREALCVEPMGFLDKPIDRKNVKGIVVLVAVLALCMCTGSGLKMFKGDTDTSIIVENVAGSYVDYLSKTGMDWTTGVYGTLEKYKDVYTTSTNYGLTSYNQYYKYLYQYTGPTDCTVTLKVTNGSERRLCEENFVHFNAKLLIYLGACSMGC